MYEKSWNVHRLENQFLLRNHKNKKDAHRHDSNFRGPMTSPSSIWSPFVKKRTLAKTSIICNCCACTRFLCMRKILVHAQEYGACTRFWDKNNTQYSVLCSVLSPEQGTVKVETGTGRDRWGLVWTGYRNIVGAPQAFAIRGIRCQTSLGYLLRWCNAGNYFQAIFRWNAYY